MLAQRVASAVAGVPIILLLIIVDGWWYAAVVAAALGIAAAEFQHLRHEWGDAETTFAAIYVAAMAVAAYADARWAAALAAGALLSPAVGLLRLRHDEPPDSPPQAALSGLWALACVLYVGGLGVFIVLLRDVPNGRDWVLLAVLATFAADTAAYFTGRAFGRHRMAPRVSPKKTWEGFAGGWAGGLAVAVAANYALGLRIDAGQIVALGLLLPLAGAAGDLVESALKRSTGVKDTSELIPGHGGVLDRLDSVLFVFALVWVFREAFVA